MHPGYGRLAELAERELRLVQAERIEDLPELWDERRATVAALPPIPPADARESLERAAAIQGHVIALLEDRMAATGAELRKLVRGRAAMQGYAPRVERVRTFDHAG
jgi:Flagellar protein FliT